MIILKIIIFIAVCAIVGFIMFKANDYTYKKYKFAFFTMPIMTIYLFMYIGFYVGLKWYQSEAFANGDTLNGILLMAISILCYIGMVIYNCKKTEFMFGSIFTIAQAVLMVVVVAAMIILGFLNFLSQVKPVVKI